MSLSNEVRLKRYTLTLYLPMIIIYRDGRVDTMGKKCVFLLKFLKIFEHKCLLYYIHIYFLINVRIKWSKKAVPGYLLMILNLSENNWKLFRSFFLYYFLCDNAGVPAKRPFFQYLLKVNNNKTTNELTRVREHSHGGRRCREKSRRFFFVFRHSFYIHKKGNTFLREYWREEN